MGVWVAESDANFIWLHLPGRADEAAVVVAGCASAACSCAPGRRSGARRALRVTVGTPAENERFVGALGELV